MVARLLDDAAVDFPRDLCDRQVFRRSAQDRAAVPIHRHRGKLDVCVPTHDENLSGWTRVPDHTRLIEVCDVSNERRVVTEDRPVEIEATQTTRVRPTVTVTSPLEATAPRHHLRIPPPPQRVAVDRVLSTRTGRRSSRRIQRLSTQ